MSIVKQFLTDERYTIVESFYDADIIFNSNHFNNYK